MTTMGVIELNKKDIRRWIGLKVNWIDNLGSNSILKSETKKFIRKPKYPITKGNIINIVVGRGYSKEFKYQPNANIPMATLTEIIIVPITIKNILNPVNSSKSKLSQIINAAINNIIELNIIVNVIPGIELSNDINPAEEKSNQANKV